MSREQTLVLVKPHAVASGWTGHIAGRYRQAALAIDLVHVFTFNEELAEEFYKEHTGRKYMPELIESMCEGPSVALVLTGENAMQRVRTLNGATDPAMSVLGTIRHDFRHPKGLPYNAVHASDSTVAFEYEWGLVNPLVAA